MKWGEHMPPLYTLLSSKKKLIRKGSKVLRDSVLEPDPNKFLFNIDTLWYTYDACNYDKVMEQGLQNKLELGKSVAESDSAYSDYIQVNLPRYEYPVTFEIQANGQAPLYRYCIRNHDMAFYFARKRRGDNSFPIKVQINQFKLWELGVQDAYIESLHVLAEMGFICETTKPNRIDPCIHSDQFIWTLNDLKTFAWPMNFAQDNFPNFVKLDPITGQFETVYFGDRSRCQLRIYNKSKEVKAKNKYYFTELYKSRGMDADNVWNIEFEIHRDYLKGFVNVETGEENFFDSMDNLLRYDGLSLLWTHLVERFVHESEFWKVLQNGDPDKFIKCKNMLFRLKDMDTEKMREVAQIRGRLQKMVVHEALPPDADLFIESVKQFVNLCSDYEEFKEKDYTEDIERKRKQYMDIQLLKMVLSEKRKETDQLITLKSLKKEKPSIEGNDQTADGTNNLNQL